MWTAPALQVSSRQRPPAHPAGLDPLPPPPPPLTHAKPRSEAEARTQQQGTAQKLSSWQLRVALGEALSSVLRLDASLLTGELLDAAATFLQDLLADECYAARLAGARLVQARCSGGVGGDRGGRWAGSGLLLACSAAACGRLAVINPPRVRVCLCASASVLPAGHAAAVRRPRARL